MGFVSSIISFFANLLAVFKGGQQAQRDALQRQAGQQQQVVGDDGAAIKAEQAMGDALAKQPETQQDFDHKLSEGNF